MKYKNELCVFFALAFIGILLWGILGYQLMTRTVPIKSEVIECQYF